VLCRQSGTICASGSNTGDVLLLHNQHSIPSNMLEMIFTATQPSSLYKMHFQISRNKTKPASVTKFIRHKYYIQAGKIIDNF